MHSQFISNRSHALNPFDRALRLPLLGVRFHLTGKRHDTILHRDPTDEGPLRDVLASLTYLQDVLQSDARRPVRGADIHTRLR